ncbi:MAG: class I mannose-6-phosphate isomerase [Lachnospirales bacterium]
MNYKSYNNYELNPKVTMESGFIKKGKNELEKIIQEETKKGSRLFVFDCYVNTEDEIKDFLKGYGKVIATSDYKLPDEELSKEFFPEITTDRVFGHMTKHSLEDCFKENSKEEIKKEVEKSIENSQEPIFVVGVNALNFIEGDIKFFLEITRWEIQLRYRQGESNWLYNNSNAPNLEKFKIGYFIEWRLVDDHKYSNINKYDYFIDTDTSEYKIVNNETYFNCLKTLCNRPFRMKPYFDKSVWGGQWMKNTYNLPREMENYGWSFDGVAEENSVHFEIDGIVFGMQTMNLVKNFPVELLGKRVYEVFGAEFPIRFDLLDTFEGGNLSLQVHPLKSYIKEKFGMKYTQDESYYILDTNDEGFVYIGLKEDVNEDEMREDLEKANKGEFLFNTEKYVNKIKVSKHDHVSIPSGTVHCSGKNTLVLEISATPYIFTFKLWDWGKLGLDGLPRPVHLDHGFENIQFDRDTKWVNKNLISKHNEDLKVQKTGLHDLEFIETNRYNINEKYLLALNDSVAVLNLVEGESAYLESKKNDFETVEIHFGETFIVPANIKEVYLTPRGNCKFLVAQIKDR